LRRRRLLSVSGLVGPQLYRWTRPCFYFATSMRASILPPHALTERPRSATQVILNASTPN